MLSQVSLFQIIFSKITFLVVKEQPLQKVFWIFILFIIEWTHANEKQCQTGFQSILESNSPQVLVIPVENDLNTFTSAKIRLR